MRLLHRVEKSLQETDKIYLKETVRKEKGWKVGLWYLHFESEELIRSH